jgi:SAM dependent carboxyl methyltransferase
MTHAMAGGGEYDRNSDPQRQDAASLLDLVVDAADGVVPDPGRGAVVLVDYGCAQGRSSTPLLRAAIERIRAHRPEVPIAVVHEDVLDNDWAGLYEGLRGEGSYLDVPGGPILPMTSASSFYEPVVPPGLVDLGVSFAALQWLARPGPGGTGSALFFDQLVGADATAMADQAHTDWTRFLQLRADELVLGGRLVVDMMGRHDGGASTGGHLWAQVRSVAEALIAEGSLDAARVDGYVFPVYERTLAEVRRPFDEALGDRFELEHLELRDSETPAWQRYEADGDADAFARSFVGFVRAFSEPSLRAALDPDGAALDELYRRLGQRAAADPSAFAFTVHVLSAVIVRTGS